MVLKDEDYVKFKKLLRFFVKQANENASAGRLKFPYKSNDKKFIVTYGLANDFNEIAKNVFSDKFGVGFALFGKKGREFGKETKTFINIGWMNIIGRFNDNREITGLRNKYSENAPKSDIKRKMIELNEKEPYKNFYSLRDLGLDDENAEKPPNDKLKKFLNEYVEMYKASKGEPIAKESNMNQAETEAGQINTCVELLSAKGNLILAGAPGTGKTRLAKDIAEQLICGKVSPDKKDQAEQLKANKQFKLIQFHPAYSYEDFVRGIVAKPEKSSVFYKAENKILGKFAEEANNAKKANKDDKYVLVIDEINRANLPAVLGELIYALEYRNESVESMYALEIEENSKKKTDNELILPDNIYIIGTMNTADRSAGQIDYAIRRRFAFYQVSPRILDMPDFEKDLFSDVSELIKTHLSSEFSLEDVQLGHSYFIADEKNRKLRLEYEIKPILREYLKDGILKGTAKEEIEKLQ
jgi:5-methylcytosine-specific restriction endonuclease McrBC GTP-binding regulatory subunit McrB